MKKNTSNYAKNKDINASYVSSNTNSKDLKPIPVSSNNANNYFTYKDFDNNKSFTMKLSTVPDMPDGAKPTFNKR